MIRVVITGNNGDDVRVLVFPIVPLYPSGLTEGCALGVRKPFTCHAHA